MLPSILSLFSFFALLLMAESRFSQIDWSGLLGDFPAKKPLVDMLERVYYRVRVGTLTGKTFSVECSDVFTVLDLKQAIFRIEKIPVDQQRLIYAGQKLRDEAFLADCSVQPDCMVFLVLRLRGGARTKQTGRRRCIRSNRLAKQKANVKIHTWSKAVSDLRKKLL